MKKNRDRRVPRISLRLYKDSPFHYLYDSGNDQALLNCTGYNHQKFSVLLNFFGKKFDSWTFNEETYMNRPKRMGLFGAKPRHLDAVGGLGLVLMWYMTRGAVSRNLQMSFGQTHSPLCKWVSFGQKILLSVLIDQPEAAITIPTDAEILFYQSCIAEKYPHCSEVWGALDGLKCTIEKSTNDRVQNHFYNGWTCGTYINSLFLFAPDGRIRSTIYNCPGTFHDSTMADYGMYNTIDGVYQRTGAKVVVDSAFSLIDDSCIIKSRQIAPENAEDLLAHKDATSIRQLSEWGMRMIQAQFPRLKDPIRLESNGDRKIIVRLMMALYNFQTYHIGHNTILNSYMVRKQSGVNEFYYGYDMDIAPMADQIFEHF